MGSVVKLIIFCSSRSVLKSDCTSAVYPESGARQMKSVTKLISLASATPIGLPLREQRISLFSSGPINDCNGTVLGAAALPTFEPAFGNGMLPRSAWLALDASSGCTGDRRHSFRHMNRNLSDCNSNALENRPDNDELGSFGLFRTGVSQAQLSAAHCLRFAAPPPVCDCHAQRP